MSTITFRKELRENMVSYNDRTLTFRKELGVNMISYNDRTLLKHLDVDGKVTAGDDEGEEKEVVVRVVKVVSSSRHLFLLRDYPRNMNSYFYKCVELSLKLHVVMFT